MYLWFGRVRGGLAIGSIIICAIFAAMTGVTGAATVTMGLIAIPAMLKRNYNQSMALGTIASSGTLGILIPPSVSMVLIGAIAQISIGKLFIGGFGPGILLTLMLILYIIIVCRINPNYGPGAPVKSTFKEKITVSKSLIAPILLICVVTGSIMYGIATPTEASALGAMGTLILVVLRKGVFTWSLFRKVTIQTILISGMVMWIVFGAVSFSALYTGIGGMELTKNLIMGVTDNRWVALAIIYAILFFLGLFLDPTGIIFIVAPVAYPIIKAFGFDPIWFGVVFVMLLQVGYITPPFGFNLFYLKATVPEGVTLTHIYKAIWPFVIIFLIGLMICTIFPEIALYLPSTTM
jgi:tripartite ATP-independent transporter DctM subunit